MKKFMLLGLFISLTINVYAQNTIKFLGIPIDGTKREMISKLEAKGYEYDSYNDCLAGEFNGTDVQISVQTINNRVWRIAVIDKSYTNETNIKIRFNNLFEQFSNNSKYVRLEGYMVNENDDISYEMTVKDKRYDVSFGLVDTSINGLVWYTIGGVYGKYKIAIFYENLNNAANGDDL
jgi:hypothetical protein